MSIEYRGGCHCGNVRALYRTSLRPSEWSVRACQCTFCRAHGALSTSDPHGSLALWADDEGLLQLYAFGTSSADFWICRACGVYVGAVMRAAPFAILNARAVQPIPADLPPPATVRYEGESMAERSARRAQRWTPLRHTP